jgi:hypothetical protein
MEKLLLLVTPMFLFWEIKNPQSLFLKEMVFILTFWNKNKQEKTKEEKLANDYVFKYYII